MKLKIFFLIIFILLLAFAGYLFVGKSEPAENIAWGANFSQKQAIALGLDWQETYLALIDQLNVKNLKVATYWDLIEPEKGNYLFDDLDWQIEKAGENEVQLLLVIGMRAPRWPECHVPDWAENLSKEEQQENILKLLESIVLRYKDSDSVWAWQVENEPFFPFGECRWADSNFLKKEIELVKSLDPKRQIVITDSGEGSFWFASARFGDIVGTTWYKKVWFHQLATYITYPFPPTFYARKAKIIDKFFGKEVICVEMQAEPWGATALLQAVPLEEQKITMNLNQFKENIESIKKAGFKKIYFWGAEWWYWMKEKNNQPEIWDEARKLF
ncbi:MAG: endo-1,4-beta-xylanase [Candidatus Nealsonbacteria bacterium]|nr:endo-1,4-beta-xylanase [Candidatus Nealsonbacteria bacterium]